MNNIEIFEKKMKAGKGKLIVGLILIVGCLFNELSFYMVMKGIKDDPVAFEDVEKVGEYTCVDAISVSDGFADYGTDTSTSYSAYYILDEDNFYIAGMNKSKFKEFDDLIDYYTEGEEDDEMPDPVRVCGITETVPTNLRKYGVEYYNKLFPENKITYADFDANFKYFINTNRGPEEDFAISSMVAGIFLLAGAIVLGLYFRDVHKTKKTLTKYANEMDKIKMEIGSPETIYEPKARMFITNERIINVANGLEIYEFKDIVWIYPHELRQNGYTTQRSIYIVTSDTKAHLVANINTSKKNNLMFDEIYESLLLRMPDALHGYTQENKNKVKEMSKKK